MITRQKITATFRKAGLTAAKRYASRMVRGWGDYSEGYKVRGNNGLYVVHEQPHSFRVRNKNYTLEKLAGYQKILKDAGIDSRIQDERLIICEQ